jgi:hypothetical protein
MPRKLLPPSSQREKEEIREKPTITPKIKKPGS